jgi:hypothetical protein
MRKYFALVYAASISAAVVLFIPVVVALRTLRKILGIKPISIWTGAPIINMAINCKAERLLGFQSFSCVTSSYFITDTFDYQLHRFARGSLILKAILTVVAQCIVACLASQVHAYVDGGLLPTLRRRQFNSVELLLYKIASIKLIIWTYGADVRTRDATTALGFPCCCSDCSQIGMACICSDTVGRKNYHIVARQATAVFAMGDMIEYCPGSNNNLYFWPIDLGADNGEKYAPVFPRDRNRGALRIVHAPNHREFKGTKYVEQAVDQLKKEGLNIELTLVERVPNEEALDIYKSADVVFDQCLIGFHGYFALEAMALGKPVMCFIRKPDAYLLAPKECPIINTSIGTLKDDLRRLASKQVDLEEIGRQGRSYIEKYYTMKAFTERLGKAYRDLGLIV